MIDNNLAANFFSPSAVVPENMNGNDFDTSKVGMEYDLSGGLSTQGMTNRIPTTELFSNAVRGHPYIPSAFLDDFSTPPYHRSACVTHSEPPAPL